MDAGLTVVGVEQQRASAGVVWEATLEEACLILGLSVSLFLSHVCLHVYKCRTGPAFCSHFLMSPGHGLSCCRDL